jgi:ribosome-binding factor A
MKDKLINSIDKSIVERKSELGRRRVSQVASSLKRLALEVVHGEFAESCCEFSIIECTMSPDLKYFDIFIKCYGIDDENEEQKFLKLLNYDDLPQHKRIQSKFFKISLKYFIVKKITERMRLRIVPIIRFKIADDSLLYVS